MLKSQSLALKNFIFLLVFCKLAFNFCLKSDRMAAETAWNMKMNAVESRRKCRNIQERSAATLRM